MSSLDKSHTETKIGIYFEMLVCFSSFQCFKRHELKAFMVVFKIIIISGRLRVYPNRASASAAAANAGQ